MNWDAIGAIGQVLGSIAVFVTLGYLAVQISHARSETKRALSQSRMEANREIIALELDALNLAARVKANAALGHRSPAVDSLMEQTGVTLEEAWRIIWMETAGWNYRINVIVQSDLLDPIEKKLFDLAIRNRYSGGVSRLLYDGFQKPGAHPDVVRYIDNLLAQPG